MNLYNFVNFFETIRQKLHKNHPKRPKNARFGALIYLLWLNQCDMSLVLSRNEHCAQSSAFYISLIASKALEDQENGSKSHKNLKMLIQGLGVTFIQ